MTIANVTSSSNHSFAIDRQALEARRTYGASDGGNRSEAEPGTSTAVSTRQDFVLGASAYRRVLATVESDHAAAVALNGSTSYSGQRALRSYQDAGQLIERDVISSLFGVDFFV